MILHLEQISGGSSANECFHLSSIIPILFPRPPSCTKPKKVLRDSCVTVPLIRGIRVFPSKLKSIFIFRKSSIVGTISTCRTNELIRLFLYSPLGNFIIRVVLIISSKWV